MSKVRTEKYIGVHVVAHCEECEWQDWSNYSVGADARKHCRETGHVVTYERGDSYRVLPVDEIIKT